VREYETTLIIQPEISDEAVQELCDRLDGVVEKGGSVRLMYDDQGRRRLAYEIQNFQKGRYVMLHFLDEGDVIPTLERALRLEDSVLRFLTVQVADEVTDIEARKAQAAEEVRIRAQKAAERAAREAEEAAERAAREEEEAAAAREVKGDLDEDEEVAESWDDAANGNEDDPDEGKDEDVGLVRDDAVGEAEVAGDQAEKEA
jgi:small subunit ribosomal protein S6